MRANNSWKWKTAAVSLLLLALAVWPAGSGAQSGTTYSGQASAVQATVLGVPTGLADTGTLYESGDAREASSLNGGISDLLSSEALHAAAVGQGDRSVSEASLAGMALTVAGNTISADFVMARAAAVCGAAPTGTAEVADLTLNGVPISVTGAPNQTVSFPGGTLVLNEQYVTADGIAVNALHVVVSGLLGPTADVVVSSATAAITCGS